jgi:multisubunit Na+/H+ antiporter MnhB subunit
MKNLWGQSRRGLVRDILIATVVGGGVALFTLQAILNRPVRTTVSSWHLENAKSEIGVTDVVGAIVTDFRGMDTVIEITVFGMAALGVLTLLSTPEPGRTWQFNIGRALRQLRSQRLITSDKQYAADVQDVDPVIQKEVAALEAEQAKLNVIHMNTPLTRKVAALVLPFALLIAVSHILYGGYAPGDGFTAGVIGGIGVALWYVVFGYQEARDRLHWLHPARLIGLGIGLAIFNAALPMLFGRGFLANTDIPIDLPAGIHFSSTTLFEIAIFLCVLGGISTILETIAHPEDVEAL